MYIYIYVKTVKYKKTSVTKIQEIKKIIQCYYLKKEY